MATAAAPAFAAFFFAATCSPLARSHVRALGEHTPDGALGTPPPVARRLERGVEHLGDVVDPAELQALAQVLRDVLEIRLVAAGGPRPPGPCARGRERLLLEAADRQHLARQRDLARHRGVGAYG